MPVADATGILGFMDQTTSFPARSRDRALRRLRRATWSVAAAAAATSLTFGLVAAATIPGETGNGAVASTISTGSAPAAASSGASSTTTATSPTTSPTTTVSPTTSGTTVAVSGGSR